MATDLLATVKHFIESDNDLQNLPPEVKRAYICIMMYIATNMVGGWGQRLQEAFHLESLPNSGDTIIKATAFALADRTDEQIKATLTLLLAE